ncbi:unnamed protein product [Eretmochelys imbricata]
MNRSLKHCVISDPGLVMDTKSPRNRDTQGTLLSLDWLYFCRLDLTSVGLLLTYIGDSENRIRPKERENQKHAERDTNGNPNGWGWRICSPVGSWRSLVECISPSPFLPLRDRQMVTHIMEETQLGDTTAGMWRHLLPVLLIWVPGVGSAYVEQLPFLTGSQGHSLVLQCTLKQSNCDRMFWCRQRGSRELEGLFYSYGDQLVNFTAELLTAQRSNKNWELKWNKLSQSDSAVYYCACSIAQ